MDLELGLAIDRCKNLPLVQGDRCPACLRNTNRAGKCLHTWTKTSFTSSAIETSSSAIEFPSFLFGGGCKKGQLFRGSMQKNGS